MNPDHITEWLLAFAVALVALAVAVAVVRHFQRVARQFRRIVEEEAPRPAVGDDTLAMLSGGPLPGPRDVQAARWPDEDTGISDEQFSRELAEWLKGDGRG